MVFRQQAGCVFALGLALIYSLFSLEASKTLLRPRSGDVNNPADCTLYVASGDQIPYSVGPGDNRTVLGYLDVNSTYRALGKAFAADGSLWWQLEYFVNKEFVWVADKNVHTRGACDTVIIVPTPVLIIPPTETPTATPTNTPLPTDVPPVDAVPEVRPTSTSTPEPIFTQEG
jgi:hypothetical protein